MCGRSFSSKELVEKMRERDCKIYKYVDFVNFESVLRDGWGSTVSNCKNVLETEQVLK